MAQFSSSMLIFCLFSLIKEYLFILYLFGTFTNITQSLNLFPYLCFEQNFNWPVLPMLGHCVCVFGYWPLHSYIFLGSGNSHMLVICLTLWKFSLNPCYKRCWFTHLKRRVLSEGGRFSTTLQVQFPTGVELKNLLSRYFPMFESQVTSSGDLGGRDIQVWLDLVAYHLTLVPATTLYVHFGYFTETNEFLDPSFVKSEIMTASLLWLSCAWNGR